MVQSDEACECAGSIAQGRKDWAARHPYSVPEVMHREGTAQLPGSVPLLVYERGGPSSLVMSRKLGRGRDGWGSTEVRQKWCTGREGLNNLAMGGKRCIGREGQRRTSQPRSVPEAVHRERKMGLKHVQKQPPSPTHPPRNLWTIPPTTPPPPSTGCGGMHPSLKEAMLFGGSQHTWRTTAL